jgi:hypothetical protein
MVWYSFMPTIDVETRLKALEAGVLEAASIQREADIQPLGGRDNGLYARLGFVAHSLGYEVEDNDELTGDILKDGRRGLRKQFGMGWILMVKQGSPLQMTATLAHEFSHHFTPDIYDEETLTLSETIAEGTAYVVCDYAGLDISSQAFPYIADYNRGEFTDEMRSGIVTASADLLTQLEATRPVV